MRSLSIATTPSYEMSAPRFGKHSQALKLRSSAHPGPWKNKMQPLGRKSVTTCSYSFTVASMIA